MAQKEGAASYSEIVAYLDTVPAASPAWAQGLYAAGLSLAAVGRLVATMAQDATSPLREAEEGVLSHEILKLNQGMGTVGVGESVGGKLSVRVRAVLSPGEQARVVRAVSGFAQPCFSPSGSFGRNGHAVMNAVRRVQASYLTARIPVGASVAEVGPDVVNWIMSSTPMAWAGARRGAYSAARPALGPRDVVRMKWAVVVELVTKHRERFFSSDVVEKAQMLQEAYATVFPASKIQDGSVVGEYILSYDSNYDIKFSDMPVAMGVCGARAWYGCLVRAKGLTRVTRKSEGSLDVLGVHYRVDWKAGRVDFRHPECQAFGYSHDVWEYMKYEEYNGYVWTTDTCHYVYSKGPETTDELLFFNVVRVPKVHHMVEPRFVENPNAGLLELTSIWSVGDEVSGVPTAFEAVKFFVDKLNFSKVLEKRRALDARGELAITVALVRSTNVRMWLHGTPVGTNKRIEARLAEATAVVVESLAAESRLSTNFLFGAAMEQYNLSLPRAGWLRRLLESVIDLKAATGKVAGPIVRMWSSVRSALIDRALASLSSVCVGVADVSAHLQLELFQTGKASGEHEPLFNSECTCAEIAEVAAAVRLAAVSDKAILEKYWSVKLNKGVCKLCKVDVEGLPLENQGNQSGGDVNEQKNEDQFNDSGISDCDESVETVSVDGKGWREDQVSARPEARAMQEFVELEQYLAKAQLVECRVDATRIYERGPISDGLLADFSTARTRHVFLEFLSGRCVRRYGSDIGVVGALYDLKRDAIVPVRAVGAVMYAAVPDGFYYSCNRLRVWNGLDLVAAVNYALDYGHVARQRESYRVTLGVPGAGKTYAMMEMLAQKHRDSQFTDFVVLAVTKESVKAAKRYGKDFGLPEDVLEARVMTLDRYLMHVKFSASLVCVDEFPMVHVGKVDAAVSIAEASQVRLYGDARQIPYDPFCAEFRMCHATLKGTVSLNRVAFLPKTHRLPVDACAMWLDQYPSIYPCDCCGDTCKDRPSVGVKRVKNLDEFVCDPGIRYHTYKQDERDELKMRLRMPGTCEELRAVDVGGLATVHEDQGSTHESVATFRLSTDYDKNASPRNPSLYNRERYVLTDTTRHRRKYVYVTMCAENDLVCKRVELSRDPERRRLVSEKKGFGNVSILDML